MEKFKLDKSVNIGKFSKTNQGYVNTIINKK